MRNITDVDDKINARAKRDHPDLPLNEAIAKVTEGTAAQFHADVAALGCLSPTHEPRATQHIGGMIAMIETLIAGGHAYAAEGEVLFDTASMPDYGALSKRKLDEQIAGARVAVDAHKKNPGDFVLWKLSDADEPGWDSPWGRGRPGWHIECSVMSAHHLGQTFDIHGGGLDLIFPHHENEIAQSRCAHGTDVMAHTWMHNGFVQVEGRKMSKSEGNFVTIHDVLHTPKLGGVRYHGLVVRFALMSSNYREPLDFTVEKLTEARAKLYELNSASRDAPNQPLPDELPKTLFDDLNFAQMRVRLDEMLSAVRTAKEGSAYVKAAGRLRAALEFLGLYDNGQSGDLLGYRVTQLPEAQIEAKIAHRLALIAEKNWVEADRIRDELLEKGIQLQDYKDPDTGERKTKWEVKR